MFGMLFIVQQKPVSEIAEPLSDINFPDTWNTPKSLFIMVSVLISGAAVILVNSVVSLIVEPIILLTIPLTKYFLPGLSPCSCHLTTVFPEPAVMVGLATIIG